MFKNKLKDKEIEELKEKIISLESKNSENKNVLSEIEKIIEHIENGFLMYEITAKSSDPQIESIKNKINLLSKNLQLKISSVSDVLLDFGVSHFESRVDEKINMTGTYGSLKSSARLIGNNVSELLAMIMSSGEKLNEDTSILSKASSSLSQSANQQAVSLEETAASIEEISSTISNNTQSIENMYVLANNVYKSASDGEKLANQTTVAMEEINIQVNSINEAITVIDQIAFQTNILSLNAAVEAATAGEAGRGFAVVAQEVRNLASRSAEAAKEIKTIVENATSKANQGKEIASHMIEGYKELNQNIQQTINLIQDIEMSSKEQLSGIEQINDAVNQLDQQTQKNAAIASQTHDVAVVTDEIAKLVVSNANAKEFIGKNEVKGRNINIKANSFQDVKTTQVTHKKIEKKPTKQETKVVSNKSDDNEWESF